MSGPDPFDRATAVTPVPGGEGSGAGRYDATLSPTWAIGERPHGGYLLAVLARAGADAVAAARGAADHPDPWSTSAVFLRSPRFGPARVEVEVLRTGRSASHAQTTILQDGVACVRALHVFGKVKAGTDPRYLDETPPALAPWADCVPRPRPPALPDGSVLRIGIAEVVEMRIDPATLTEAPVPPAPRPDDGGPRAELRAWQAFADGRAPDPLSLLFTVDALPPVTFALGTPGWVPTLELTAYVRALPAPGPVRVRQRGRLLQDGRLDEVCDVWDSAGRLVAQASQLAGVRDPA
jgi:acyl-coenzyme A thioesterase PaaI-like protein